MDDQTQQGSQDDAQVSQETPGSDSQLQTPQADQPVPTEPNRDGEGQLTQAEGQQNESADPAPSLAERDQVREEQARAEERQQQVQEHAARTGGGEVQADEVVVQREEHNARVSTESVQADSVDGSQDQ